MHSVRELLNLESCFSRGFLGKENCTHSACDSPASKMNSHDAIINRDQTKKLVVLFVAF